MKNKRKLSSKYYNQAIKLMPAGVNSPVRAFKAVGGKPVFIKQGKGSKIYDVDGNSYIDYVLSWGPLILGHAEKSVINSLTKTAKKGTSFGASTVLENKIISLIQKAIPCMQRTRLVNSGTEATMSAIRLARSFTKKNKIIKFEGCYHGHSDGLLVKAGSGATTFSAPTSSGVLKSNIQNTIVLAFNDTDRLKKVILKEHKNIAAVIVEPVCGNMGVVTEKEGFLKQLRKITKQYGILLIFDEVMTGFRFCFGGVQNLLNVKPDITCLGKIIGGGMPIAAYGASKKIMDNVAPSGGMYQAGTLSGNPVAVSCGLQTLKILKNINYNKLEDRSNELINALKQIIKKSKQKIKINHFKSMFTLFFTEKDVFDYKSALSTNTKRYAKFFNLMLDQGVYFAPSAFEANFLSFAHTKKDIKYTIEAFENIIDKI